MNPSMKCKAPVTGLLASTVVTLGLSTGLLAHAEYNDPIDIPARVYPSSVYSLLLDATVTSERTIVAGERGHILYSDDNGENWTQAEVPSSLGLNALTMANDHVGWAVGEDQLILKTTDGGKSWQHQYDGRDADTKGPLLDVVFKNENEGLAVGVYNRVVHTTDGGKTWEDATDRVDNLDEWHLFSISAADENNLYIASEMGLIFKSTDGGESFTEIQTDHDGSFHGLLTRKAPSGEDSLLLFGVGGIVYTSPDSGQSWNQVDTGIGSGLAGGAFLDDGSAVVVGMEGVVMKLELASSQVLALHLIDNGLPLNAVVQNEDKLILAGLGGIQIVETKVIEAE